jgi:hypothetical protein
MSTAAAATTRVESVLQQVELELWRDNIDGALRLLASAHALSPNQRYAARAEEVRSWLLHLKTDEACFAVPMNELVALGALPAFQPLAGVAGHVRVFTEAGLRERFGNLPEFSLTKLPGRWRPGRYPATLAPVEYGAFFVAVSAL